MRSILFYLLFLHITLQKVRAQSCVADYFFNTYKGPYSQKIVKSIATSKNELLSVGSVFYSKNNMFFQDGWIMKTTPQGTVIWSKQYSFLRHNAVELRDIVLASDSTYFATGIVFAYGRIDTVKFSRERWGVVLQIDKQGRLLRTWQLSARFNPLYESSSLESISQTGDGDLMLCGNVLDRNNPRATQFLIKMGHSGKVRWTVTLSSNQYAFELGSTKMLPLGNGNIVVAGLLNARLDNSTPIAKWGYYFLALDHTTGGPLWSHTYLFLNDPAASASATYYATSESLQHITELPNGNLSFVAYTTDASGSSNPPYTSTAVNIVTNATGDLQQATAYNGSQQGTYPAAAVDAGNGEQLILIDDGQNAPLAQIDNSGQLQWVKGYATGSTIAPASLNAAASGYYLFLNDRGPYGGTSYLMKVDATASIDCKNAPAQLTTKDVATSLTAEAAPLNVLASTADTVLFDRLDVVAYDYPVQANTNCSKACCNDVTSTAQDITLCSGASYTLPDHYVVRDSGTYYVSFKTPKGCDSIAYYHFNVVKNPTSLQLRGKTCFDGTDTVVLSASSGFRNYNWNNILSTDSTYTVSKPGVYWVSVSNSCGTKKDSLEVFEKCNFPIYMPSAFTPNSDGINDYFGFPPQNKNRLVQLLVYNRWGQLVFRSSGVGSNWDGTYKGKLQATGAYIYVVQARAPNGKLVTTKGTVLLIR